jgi:hypothetical protein
MLLWTYKQYTITGSVLETDSVAAALTPIFSNIKKPDPETGLVDSILLQI